MLNFGRNDRPGDPLPGHKPALKPAPYAPEPASSANRSQPHHAARDATGTAPVTSASTPEQGARAISPETPGSKLFIGPNIRLKGVEISNCDVLVVEGQVEATVNSKAMQIARPGTLKGVAVIDVAEIDGEFTGELTAHTRLVVHGTGRVSGTIRYGRLIVADGGEISGDVKRLDVAAEVKPTPRATLVDGRLALSPQPTA
jgi:cytoskeletal protein CcmA (bactofilin family)